MPGMWDRGGVASYIRRVSAAQRSLGHEIIYFDLLPRQSDRIGNDESIDYLDNETDLPQRARARQVEILHLHLGVTHLPSNFVPLIRTVHGHQPYCPSGSRFLRRSGRACNRNYSAAGCLWGHFADRCGSVRPHKLLDDFRRTWNERRTLTNIRVVTVSQFIKDQMVSSGYRAEWIDVLHLPGPDRKNPAFPFGQSEPHFLFLGRITNEKGVAWLLRSLKETKVRSLLTIAGSGPQERKMRALCADLELNDRVTFLGWVDAETVQGLLAKSTALVFPSVWHEPGGTVAMEAMVNARAVIMSRVGGMPEVIQEGVNGLLVEPNDITGLAEAMDQLASDPEAARRLGDAGLALATTRYSLEHHVAELLRLYRESISVFESGQVCSDTIAQATL